MVRHALQEAPGGCWGEWAGMDGNRWGREQKSRGWRERNRHERHSKAGAGCEAKVAIGEVT